MTDETRILVGAIAGAFGTRGEVRLKSFCAEPAAIADYKPLTSKDGVREFDLKITRPVKGGYAARIKGVQFRDQADALKGVQLFAPRTALPSLPDDEFYHADLIGLQVMDTGGVDIGKITGVFDHGAGDFLEIRIKGEKTPMLLPFTQAAVPVVDLTQARVIIDPPEDV